MPLLSFLVRHQDDFIYDSISCFTIELDELFKRNYFIGGNFESLDTNDL